ncbi:MAG TPA: hypothetical protein DD808_01480 [Halieaceae bacterium]|jgi:hypothetical protein|uniref:hypothetical protein n=1 Tax=Haliea TaxID=475794 RepID=UPI000C3C6C12|nr:hypothetical protein [Haliea sp.]HAN68349.1 hypothetical protein [Halieaceae bacterium]MAY94740.1 hypothetical protein [Haliea sp.]MBP71744.1 hypothetical protein [Haliea sp.]HBM82726.1 hypothetical protein [Halieaceae bacterium]HBQ39234.1 hypothetical protein [Halieaceae bacterium]|tara:strand:- start:10510 stop:10863 length:354 start_codon:yes stop_codon:yes gene_type:complete
MTGQSDYLVATLVYLGAALCALGALFWWLRRRWSPLWRWVLLLAGAALLMTPAYPYEGVNTFAPALVVAAFQLLTAGPEAAAHAVRPLAAALGLAMLLTLLLYFTVLRRARHAPGDH